MNCDFEKRGEWMVCVRDGCDQRVPITDPTWEPWRYVATCGLSTDPPIQRPATCIHLGEPTGEVALIKCQSCQGNVRRKLAVHSCGVFGECLPTFNGETQPQYQCHGCDRYATG